MLSLILSWILALLGRRFALRRGCVHAGRKAASRAPVPAAALAMLDPNGCHRAAKQHHAVSIKYGQLALQNYTDSRWMWALQTTVYKGRTVVLQQCTSLRRRCKALASFHALRPLSCEPLVRVPPLRGRVTLVG